MKEYKVKLKGKTPYMQHRMDDTELEKWEKGRGLIIERKGVNEEDLIRAKFHSYLDENNQHYLPTEQIRQSLINAGAYMKSKVGNSRKSMKNIVSAMFYIKEEKINLPDSFEIDKRSAVNKNVKARVICIRPKWNEWEIEFTLQIDNDTITQEIIQDLFQYAGNYVGVGSYRPQNNGMFGRFELESLKSL